MKKVLQLAVFIVLANVGNAQQVSGNKFILKGEFTGYGDGQILITYSNPNEKVKPDTIPVRNDQFLFEGRIEAPMMAFFKLMRNNKLNRDFFRLDFILESGVTEINADLDNLEDYQLTGAANNTMFRKMMKEGNDKIQDFLKAEKAFRAAKDDDPQKEALRSEMERKQESYLQFLLTYDRYFDTYAGAYSLWLFSQRRVPWQQLDTLLSKFNDSVKNSPYFVYMQRRVDAAKRIESGQKAADFVVKDLKGRSYSMQDFRGHYLLVTFSASWCIPCKAEYPYLKKAFDKYSSKGLKMIVMNVDDSREKWEGDVKKYKFPFPVLSDLHAFDGPLTKNYGVMSIPKIFLIDPDGKIVSSTIRQQGILDKLEEVYH